jgi:hypothetical protein
MLGTEAEASSSCSQDELENVLLSQSSMHYVEPGLPALSSQSSMSSIEPALRLLSQSGLRSIEPAYRVVYYTVISHVTASRVNCST